MTFDGLSLYNSIGRAEFDHTLLANALLSEGYAAPNKKIHDLVKAGVILAIKRGLYTFPPSRTPVPIQIEALANMIYGPSCISLEYALSYHGLIPERTTAITSVTPKRDKRFETAIGTFTYRYLAKQKYSVGIELISLSPKHNVFIASPEKALLDYVELNKIQHIDSPENALEFLQDDLRIDQENWGRFNIATMHSLNRIYKNAGVDQILSALEKHQI